MKRNDSWIRKTMGLVAALGLTFAMGCATTDDYDDEVVLDDSDVAGAAQTSDPLGPPQHIESSITNQHPSSNTGAGNADGTGANTNLNRTTPEPRVTITDSAIIEEETVVIESEPVIEEPVQVTEVQTTTIDLEDDEEEEPVRRITRKE